MAHSAARYLGDEDALIGGVTGVPRMALGASSDADAQFLPWPLFNADFLKSHTHKKPHARKAEREKSSTPAAQVGWSNDGLY